ncbi:MAG: serine hydrolase [Snowella sp.]
MSRKNSRRSTRSHISLVPQPTNVTTLTVVAEQIAPTQAPRQRKPTREPNWVTKSLLYTLRVGILGAGLAVIAGTTLTVFAPTRFLSSQASTSKGQEKSTAQKTAAVGIKPQEAIAKFVSTLTPQDSQADSSARNQIQLTEELIPLKQKLANLDKKQAKIETQAFFIDLDNGKYVNLAGDTPISAASLIKIPIAIAFFQDVDAGKIKLNEKLPMGKDVIASGSGDMQYQQGQKSFTALETVTKMIAISDNTATNMLIKRMGGKAVLDQRFQAWGLTHTQIHNLLPDLEGTNMTSSKDLATVLLKVNQGELISLKSRDRLLGIMQETKTRTLLPPGLESGAIISHKTGDIGTVLGDAGIIDMPSGKRYIQAIIAKRPYNDIAARTLIQDMSRATYQHLKATESIPVTKPPSVPTKVAASSSSEQKKVDPKKAMTPATSILKKPD